MPNRKKIDDLIVEDARIVFRPNFSGREERYNRAGDRNFCIAIDDPVMAQRLTDDGWNIRIKEPVNEGDEALYYLQVAVRFDNFPPKVTMMTQRNRKGTILDEESIEALDYADIRNVDLIIHPSFWEVSGKSGIKAYLKTMYVTIEEDVFAAKYAESEHPEE